MNKNEIYQITIEDMGNDGEGIGRVTDKQNGNTIAVFVKDAVIGDIADIKIIKVKKSYAYGRVEKIVKKSEYRIEPPCYRADVCGGCSIMQVSYEKQLEYKWNKVRSCMERIGDISYAGDIMEPIIGMDSPYNYRNKMQFPVGVNREGRVQIGFYAGRTHSVIDIDECAIGHSSNSFIIKRLRGWIQSNQDKSGRFVYNEEQHKGIVRHILTRIGFSSKELMVCLVINAKGLGKGNEQELVSILTEAVNEYNEAANNSIQLASVMININSEKTNRILGDECRTLYGKSTIKDYIGDVCFEISPLSFYQVNPGQTEKLYDKALNYAGLTGNENVWDMYCGIGTISLFLAKHAKHVYGVEIVPQAIEDAKTNATLNNISNTEFFCGKAEDVVPKWFEDNASSKIDVIVVDPPRKGCDEELLATIKDISPDRLVYVSCDPATLARDIKILVEDCFRVEKICPVDQFGHSGHVETVVALHRTNS